MAPRARQRWPGWLTLDRAGDVDQHAVRGGAWRNFARCSAQLAADPPRGLVIRSGKANGFIAGADVDEFGGLESVDDAIALVRRGWDTFDELAATPYPTLALVRGFCLGGGMELALACRYRVAVDDPSTRFGLPEVMLGIVPGWGGIKRLPPLTGAPAALDMLLTGRTVDARRARKLGIADECVPPRIMDNAARGVLLQQPPPRRAPFPLSLTLSPVLRPLIAAQARKQVARRARREHYPAPYAILDIWVKHDGDPLAAAPSDPASIAHLLQSPTARNLIRVFKLQERLKAFGKEGESAIRHVHVVGAGTMGGDIAAWCALRGLTVTLQDQNAERLAPAIGRAAKLFGDRLRDPLRARDAFDRLVPDVAGDGVARADVIIEAIFENLDAKQKLFVAIEAKAKSTALLATNTSSIPLEEIGAPMADPTRLIGLHFFNPVARMMLVEIVVGKRTRAELVPVAAAFARKIDKLPLPVKSAPGFLVNRILAPYLMEAMRCVDEGISPETVDEAALAFGMPVGPIELADSVGLDICLAVGKMLGGRRGAAEKAHRADCGGRPGAQDRTWVLRLAGRQGCQAAAGGRARGPCPPADRSDARQGEGGARRGDRCRRRPGGCRGDLRHRLRTVHRRAVALCCGTRRFQPLIRC